MRVLILTGSFGLGHIKAAKAIKEEIEEVPWAEVESTDIVYHLFPSAGKHIYKVFDVMSGRLHGLYNIINRLDEKKTISPMKKWFYKKFGMLMEEKHPDVVISTLPVVSKYTGNYIKNAESSIKYITCITDIVPHSEWLSEKTNAYIVGDEMTKDIMVKKGVDQEKIFVGGIPVRKAFKNNFYETDKKGKSGKTVLLMGGGLGLIPGADVIIDELIKVPEIKVTVITGRNEKLMRDLKRKYSEIEVIGYCENTAEYINEADIIISKAGGITVFEAIYAETPMAVMHPFLEQEKKNAELVEKRNIGVVMGKDKDRYSQKVIEMLYDEKGLCLMKENMKKMKKSYESCSISNILYGCKNR